LRKIKCIAVDFSDEYMNHQQGWGLSSRWTPLLSDPTWLVQRSVLETIR